MAMKLRVEMSARKMSKKERGKKGNRLKEHLYKVFQTHWLVNSLSIGNGRVSKLLMKLLRFFSFFFFFFSY